MRRPNTEFGHFSEWMLAANYSARGYKVGYLPEARVRHYYIGSLPELKAFTLDFVAGEIRHFSRSAVEPGTALLEPPEEWTCRDNFEPGMARAILGMCARDIVGGRGMEAIGRAKRWLGPAIFGDGIAGAVSVAAVLRVRLAMTLALAGSSREQLGACFKDYIGALIRRQRLACIRAERRNLTQRGSDTNAVVLKQTGFYPLEQYQGSAFRWSETEAAVRIRARPAYRSIRIECAPVRSLSERMDVRFFFRWQADSGGLDLDRHRRFRNSGGCIGIRNRHARMDMSAFSRRPPIRGVSVCRSDASN